MPTTSLLQERREDGVAILRLDRPQVRNALDTPAIEALLEALDELGADESVRAVVLSTTNERALCAGADVSEALDAEAGLARAEAFARLYAAVEAFPAATVCVCVGNTVGAGAELAAGCDLRVGGDNLKLAWAGARLGVPIGPARLVPLIGLAAARDLILTGRVVGMEEAAALGFLQRTAAAADAEAVAIELAAAVAAHPPGSVRGIKALFRDLDGAPDRVALENERLVDFQRHGGGLPQGSRS
jgi:enoyl-CoA hydratase/carnithine racemase